MSAPSRQNTPHPVGGSRYGPTPAAPGGGAGRRTPATAAGGEVRRWSSGDPGGRPQAQPPPTESAPQGPGGPSEAGDALARLPEVLTVREMAAILRVGRNQLYEAVARGEVRAVRIGRSIRIPKTALLDLLSLPDRPGVTAASK
jgi:excisionase family DNA binding protein